MAEVIPFQVGILKLQNLQMGNGLARGKVLLTLGVCVGRGEEGEGEGVLEHLSPSFTGGSTRI